MPFGTGQAFLNHGGWVNQAAGGWELAGLWTLRSGAPFTPTIGTDVANTGVGSQWPLVVGKPTLVHSPDCWFYVAGNSKCSALSPGTTAAFKDPPRYSYGDPVRNSLYSGSLNELDFNIIKTFYVREGISLEFHAEAFNLLNHPSFSAPSTNIDSSSGGQVSSTINSSRELQFALKVHF